MKTWAIAKVGFKECLRYRVVYGIFLIAVFFIIAGKGCNPGKIKGEDLFFSEETRQQIALGAAFHGIIFWSIMLCGLVSAQVLSRELDEGTALMTLSRPVRRSTFVMGKLLSLLMISVFNLYLLAAIFFVLFTRETGIVNPRIFLCFTFMILSLLTYGLMGMLVSLLVPRLLGPLICFAIYLSSIWSSLPFYYERIKIIWEPSPFVALLHRFMPRFGDLQFIGAALISESVPLSELMIPLVSTVLYSTGLFASIVLVCNRRQLQ